MAVPSRVLNQNVSRSSIKQSAFFIFLIHDILTNPAWGGKDYFYMAEIVLKYFMMAVTHWY